MGPRKETILLWGQSRHEERRSTVRWHGGAVVSTVASTQGGSGFERASRLGPFCVDVLSSPAWVSSACSGFLPQRINVQVRLTGDSKSPVGVNVSRTGCLSRYVGALIDLWNVQGGIDSQPLRIIANRQTGYDFNENDSHLKYLRNSFQKHHLFFDRLFRH